MMHNAIPFAAPEVKVRALPACNMFVGTRNDVQLAAVDVLFAGL
jgi:hypothetical protein